jgi:hypothetical protein
MSSGIRHSISTLFLYDRFSKLRKSIKTKTPEKAQAYRDEIKRIRDLSQSLKKERKQMNEEKRQRRLENQERRKYNSDPHH